MFKIYLVPLSICEKVQKNILNFNLFLNFGYKSISTKCMLSSGLQFSIFISRKAYFLCIDLKLNLQQQ